MSTNATTKLTPTNRSKYNRPIKLPSTLREFHLKSTSPRKIKADANREHNAIKRNLAKRKKESMDALEEQLVTLPNINDHSNSLIRYDTTQYNDTECEQSELETARLLSISIAPSDKNEQLFPNTPPSTSRQTSSEFLSQSQSQYSMFQPRIENISTQLCDNNRPQYFPNSHNNTPVFSQLLPMPCTPQQNHIDLDPKNSVEASLRQQIVQLQTKLAAAMEKLAAATEELARKKTGPCGKLCELNISMSSLLTSYLQTISEAGGESTNKPSSSGQPKLPAQIKKQDSETLVELSPGSEVFVEEGSLAIIRLDGGGNPRQIVRLLLSEIYNDDLANMSASGQGRHKPIPGKVAKAILSFANNEKSNKYPNLTKGEFIDTVNKKCGTVRRRCSRKSNGASQTASLFTETGNTTKYRAAYQDTTDATKDITQVSQVDIPDSDSDASGMPTHKDILLQHDLSETDEDVTMYTGSPGTK